MNYGIDGEHGNNVNTGLVSVISESPLTIDWTNAFNDLSALNELPLSPGDTVYIRADNDLGEQIEYSTPTTLNGYEFGDVYLFVDPETQSWKFTNPPFVMEGVGNNKALFKTDGYWCTKPHQYTGMLFKNLELWSYTGGRCMTMYNSSYTVLKDCIFHNHIYGSGSGFVVVDNCEGMYSENSLILDNTHPSRDNFYFGFKNYTGHLTEFRSNGNNFTIGADLSGELSLALNFYYCCICSHSKASGLMITYTYSSKVSYSWFKGYETKLIKLAYGRFTNNTFENDLFYFRDESILTESEKYVYDFENCVIKGETGDVTWLRANFPEGKEIVLNFKNCIISNLPDEADFTVNTENCLIGADPLLDENGIPTSDSPCLPKNWTGVEPIDSFIGWKDFYLEPTFSSLSTDAESDYIPILFYVEGSQSFKPSVEYSIDNGSTWNPCSIIFDNDEEVVPNQINTFLWNSKSDITTDESIKIRIYGNDGFNDSNTIEGTFNVFNAPKVLVNPVVEDIETYDFKGDIEIGFTAFDDSSILSGEVEYYDTGNWYSCTLKYNSGNKFLATDLGERNTILWDSENNISTELITKVRIKTTDIDGLDSGWVESGLFLVDNDYIPAVISDISLDSSSEDITISYSVQDDDYSILKTEIQYYDDNDNNWYSCNLKYMNELYSVASETGENNTILWDSFNDIPEDMTSEIRIRVNDGVWTDWENSGPVTILNGTLPPKPIAIEKIKVKIKETEKVAAKLKVI